MYSKRPVDNYKYRKAYLEANSDSDSGTKHVSRVLIYYVFADGFLVPDMKEYLLDEMHDHYNEGAAPLYCNVKYAYDNLGTADPLLKLLVDGQAESWRGAISDWYEERDDIDNLPREFLHQVMARMQEMREKKMKSAVRKREVYREHPKKESSEVTKNVKKQNGGAVSGS